MLFLQALTAEFRFAAAGKSYKLRATPFLLQVFLMKKTSLLPMQFLTIRRLSTPYSTATKTAAVAEVSVLLLAAVLTPTELKMLSLLAVPLVALTIICMVQMNLRKSQHSL